MLLLSLFWVRSGRRRHSFFYFVTSIVLFILLGIVSINGSKSTEHHTQNKEEAVKKVSVEEKEIGYDKNKDKEAVTAGIVSSVPKGIKT